MRTVRASAIIAVSSGLLAVAAPAAVETVTPETVTMVTVLNGQQQSVPVRSDGRGCGRFVIDTEANTVTYHIVFSGMNGPETAAHIHGPAGIGQGADVVHVLPPGNPKLGTWSYEQSHEADLLAGRMYVNIHSAPHPPGELRGQIVDMVALLDGAQSVPPSGTSAAGWGLFDIDADRDELSYHVVLGGLGGPEESSHIGGFALHGAEGAPLHALPGGAVKVGTWTYDAADEQRLLDGQAYVSVQTTAFPGGELRGQITRLLAPGDGDQVPADSAGHGCGLLALDADAGCVSIDLRARDLAGPVTSAALHGFAPPGEDAPELLRLPTAFPALATWCYEPRQGPSLLAGLAYFAVSTAERPGGEVRGQILFPPPACPADTNGDRIVNVQDLVNVILAWGTGDPAADVNDDGVVDVTDLVAVILGWGRCDG